MKQTIRLILAVLLFLCLADMPYGYYNFVRFVAAFAFAYFAFEYYKKEREGLAFTFGAFALLFQPFIKLALGRVMWNVVAVVVGLGLVYLTYLEFKKKD